MHWAQGLNKHITLNEQFIKAYFEEGKNIHVINVLLKLTIIPT